MRAAKPYTSSAASVTDKRYQYTYFTNGDFQQDGDNKQFMFYEYLPANLSWDTLNQMTVNAVAEGTRCNYRVLGYRSGGGGTLVFDSGWLGQYGVAIDITGANFDYYNVILSLPTDFDENTPATVGNIDSCYIIFAWGELVQLPTTPPELINGVDAIESGINGTATETLPTVVSTATFTTMVLDDPNSITNSSQQFSAGWNIIQTTFKWIYSQSDIRFTIFIAMMMTLAVVSYIFSKGW